MPYLSPLPQTDILQSQPRPCEVSRGKIGRSGEFASASGNLLVELSRIKMQHRRSKIGNGVSIHLHFRFDAMEINSELFIQWRQPPE